MQFMKDHSTLPFILRVTYMDTEHTHYQLLVAILQLGQVSLALAKGQQKEDHQKQEWRLTKFAGQDRVDVVIPI